MKTKHTPEKWQRGDAHLFINKNGGVFKWIGEDRICIVESCMQMYRDAFRTLGRKIPDEISIETEKANLILITAAPEMLETLKWLENKTHLGLESTKRIKEIIKKAEGT